MVRRPGSIRLAEVLGIRIGVDASWFVVLFLIIFSLSSQFRNALAASDGVAYLTAVAAAFLFFASIVVHELGHALAARREGIETTGIDLWFFGGLARLSREARTPGEEFRMAAAGPAVTLAVVALCFGLGVAFAGWDRYLDAAALRSGAEVSPALLLLTWLASINVLLLVFNLVPAYPLDGGRIARAAVWRVTGDRGRGTRAAARVGQLFGWVLVGLGLFALLRGVLDGIVLIVLGLLLTGSARGAMMQSDMSERIEGVRVADIMDADPVSVPSELPLERARDDYFLRYRWGWFPVVDGLGRFVGTLREERARDGGSVTVGAVMDAADDWRVDENQPLEALLRSEPLRRRGALVAVDRDGRLRGVVTLDQVRRALTAAFSSPAG